MGKPPGIKNRKTLETMRTNGNNSGSGSASLNHTPQQSQELSSASTARLSSTTRHGGSSSVTSPTTMESDLSMVDVDSFMRHDFPGTASDLGFDMPTSLEQSLDYQSPLATGTTDAWSSGVSKAAAPLCNCMKSQADKLCTLRTIEQRQSPVKVDTILSCVKLVSQAAESQLQCSFCQIDCYTLLLTISTFQLIFHWVRAQTHHPEKACDNTSIKLGQYEISKQDATMLKDILVARAFDTTLTSLKLLRSRVNQLVVDAQCKELWDFERAPIQNLQNMTQSLMQTSSVLSKRLRNHF
ncbi:MAG: hypothetical protein MMC23_007307 [Stictis urceolatum]|nr:hypothetical protein [Stictis urceolata]